jgi:hypothetical protein
MYGISNKVQKVAQRVARPWQPPRGIAPKEPKK